ncbi:AP-1-like transcription factor CAP1 [Pseudocercospora fuligena]|uniref:AP-1-like transcription factor CAP1 n=1 Tax=Pseudocercospora fuligena TaxID=685502 RepID=A0A8H6VIY2_9PEZI|nr:AP-1-like transcription factor CAP1 [Pseudocercospora fuligena]
MTSNPKLYSEWCPGHATLPDHPQHEPQDFLVQNNSHPYWLISYHSTELESGLDSSNISSPDMSYQDLSFQPQLCNSENYLDFQRIGTPQNLFDDDELGTDAQVGIETSGNGANKRVRRREQNRASQRAYRDRQRGKIAELQAKIMMLKGENEKLQARNNMLEAASQRQTATSKNQAVHG